MKKYFNENKKVLIPLIAVITILVVGVTYAWLTQVLNGTQVNRIKAGVLELTLDDNASNGIDLEYAVPQSDEQGLNNTAYTFTVRNTGSINAEYKLYLEDEEIEGEKIDDSKIKYSISRNNSIRDSKLLSASIVEEKRQIENTIIAGGSTNEYSLKLWIDQEATKEEVANKIFKAKIKLEAIQTEKIPEVSYEMEGYVYDDNNNKITNGAVVVYSIPMYANVNSEGYFDIKGLLDGNHTLYYVSNKTATELKNMTREEIETLDNVGIAHINGNISNQLTLSNGYTIKSFAFKEFKLASGTSYDFNGEDALKEFIAIAPGEYKIELWGAQGCVSSYGAAAGNGAYTSGIVKLKTQQQLYVAVGMQNNTFNGGGAGSDALNCSGGGATDVRITNGNWNDSKSLASRIMVAAGAGGSSMYQKGGAGGALVGLRGDHSYHGGYGGTQTAGGAGGAGSYTLGRAGSFGIGGYGDRYMTGGGGGYYGGGSDGINTNSEGGGGGGSSYISGYVGCVAITGENDLTPKCSEGTTKECSIHYSNIEFTDPVMYAGNEEMPTHDGTGTMIGNSGNGYAKITYLGK